MKTLNIDPHLAESKENFSRNGGNVPSEGDSARALPNNIPKKSILKKKTEEGINDRPSTEPIRKQPEAEVTKTADKNQAPPEDFSSLKDKFADLPSAEKNEFRRFVIQESFGKAPPQFVDLSDIMNSQSIKESTDKLPGTKNVETANKQKNSNIKIEDQEKEEGEIYEDDYEDDFELSQSQVKSQFLQKSSQLRESKGEFNGDETASFDVSTITQKTFDGGYLEKLDRIVSKNKADVEVNLKDFSK